MGVRIYEGKNMTRGSFLKLKIPCLPYHEFYMERPYRTVSNNFNETIHMAYDYPKEKKKYNINIWWSRRDLAGNQDISDIGEVTVNYHDMNEKNEHKRIHTLIHNDKHFTQEKLTEVIKEILT